MTEVLRVEDLRVEFETAAGQVKALNGVSFAQEEGQIYCIVGESGAGKSTLALAIMGLLPQSATLVEGSVSFNGVDLMRASPDYMRGIRGKEITMVFQDAQTALNPVQTVGTQLEEVILNHTNMSTREANRMAQDVLRDLGLPDPRRILGEYPFNLSGGMCQRVMIAIALVLQPRLLIADEATSGLDVTLQAEILDRLKRLCRELNSAILLITHDLGIVAHMGNRVGVMYAGSLAETADVIPLFKEPRHPYTWSLIQSLPRLDDVGRRLQPLRGSPPNMLELPEECAFLPRCHKALSRCRLDPSPMLEEVSEGHRVACYNPMVE
ncbi:MAG: ABC transporter ATP-binding protein [Chloroflexi bacterium]|nr:ABC transporter ATP-binding protein [Chloroflexota bacterium]